MTLRYILGITLIFGACLHALAQDPGIGLYQPMESTGYNCYCQLQGVTESSSGKESGIKFSCGDSPILDSIAKSALALASGKVISLTSLLTVLNHLSSNGWAVFNTTTEMKDGKLTRIYLLNKYILKK